MSRLDNNISNQDTGVMRRLPEILRKNGYTYKLIKRGKQTCIYAQYYDNEVIAFEVFKIKIAKETNFGDTKIKARERFPHDESFGIWSWSMNSFEKASRKFEVLEEHKGLNDND